MANFFPASETNPLKIKINCRLHGEGFSPERNSGIVYTDAVSNRHIFMTLKPHRKQYGFEAFTRNRYNHLRYGDLVPRRSRFVKWIWERVKKSSPSRHVRYFPLDEWSQFTTQLVTIVFAHSKAFFSFFWNHYAVQRIVPQNRSSPPRPNPESAFAFLFVSLERNGWENTTLPAVSISLLV